MSSSLGDMEILNQTVRSGDSFSYPALEVALQIADGTQFQKATYWCNFIRGEYKREEERIEWEAEQASTRGNEEAVLRAGNTGGDTGTEERSGNVEPVVSDIQSNEGTLEEILERRLFIVQERIKVTNNRLDAIEREAFVNRDTLEQLKAEEIAVRTALEVTCGTRENDDSMGVNLHRQISGEGQDSSGVVGDEDNTSPAPQKAGSKSKRTRKQQAS